jgi:hypothetical protein
MSTIEKLRTYQYKLEYISNDGEEWTNTFKQIDPKTAVILLYIFSVIQIGCLLMISALLLKISMHGLRFGDL